MRSRLFHPPLIANITNRDSHSVAHPVGTVLVVDDLDPNARLLELSAYEEVIAEANRGWRDPDLVRTMIELAQSNRLNDTSTVPFPSNGQQGTQV